MTDEYKRGRSEALRECAKALSEHADYCEEYDEKAKAKKGKVTT